MFNNFGTIINTLFFGKKAGKDSFGNIYYLNKKNKRWVIYYKNNDSSSVPPEWQAWLTYTLNEIPKNNNKKNKWQISHKANTTGIENIFNKNNQKEQTEKPAYSAWSPKKESKRK